MGINVKNRNQRGQSDTSQLINTANYIRKRWHLDFKREWYVGFDRETGRIRRITESVDHTEANTFRWRNPDLLHIHKSFGLIVIEIDGSIHDKKTSATTRRNQQYEQGHCKLIVISLSYLKSVGRTVEAEIDCKMMKLLREPHIGIELEQEQ